MSLVFVRTRWGTTEQLAADLGQRLAGVVRMHRIPRNAVRSWRNGEILAEDAALIKPGDRPGIADKVTPGWA